ncbi:MAG: DHH family phosphoesterase [Ruminococcus flavefaciens]|nr:DHH family phosphoesterase [Ruminococcus flavefaciens]
MISVRDSIANWVTNSNPNTYRIHLSHTDLDGYGCQLITHSAEMLLKLRNRIFTKYQPIIYGNMSYGKDDQADTIAEMVDIAISRGYHRGSKVLSFLVSDIARFDPTEAFQKLIDDGHLVHWLIVDHHVDHSNLEDLPRTTVVIPGNYHDELYTGVYIDTDHSATYHLEEIMMPRVLESIEFGHQDVPMMGMPTIRLILRDINYTAGAISDSDTGHWGNWADHIRDREPPTLALTLRLLFQQYDESCMPEQWLWDELYKIFSPTQHSLLGHTDDIVYRQKSMLRQQWAALCVWYVSAEDCVRPLADYERFKGLNGYPVFELIDRPEWSIGHMFSMISAEILRKNPHIGILLYDNKEEGSISLRTAKDDISCADIARLNGGGGHPKAAGFNYEE